MKTFTTITALGLLIVFGCASPDGIKDHNGHIKSGDSSSISVGMNKLEVMRALGKPEATEANASGETLVYRLERPWWQDKPFKVELKDDKVTSFGVVEK
jgi:hypothetical protein